MFITAFDTLYGVSCSILLTTIEPSWLEMLTILAPAPIAPTSARDTVAALSPLMRVSSSTLAIDTSSGPHFALSRPRARLDVPALL